MVRFEYPICFCLLPGLNWIPGWGIDAPKVVQRTTGSNISLQPVGTTRGPLETVSTLGGMGLSLSGKIRVVRQYRGPVGQ